MRARNIKPGFFKNEELADIEPMARLLFIGLWCYADREGRFELRPKKIRAEIFPYENVDIMGLLHALSCHGFVITWSDNGNQFGQIVNFSKHQNPHPHEAKSKIPEYNQCHDVSVTLRDLSAKGNADIMIPDSLEEDSNTNVLESGLPPGFISIPEPFRPEIIDLCHNLSTKKDSKTKAVFPQAFAFVNEMQKECARPEAIIAALSGLMKAKAVKGPYPYAKSICLKETKNLNEGDAIEQHEKQKKTAGQRFNDW